MIKLVIDDYESDDKDLAWWCMVVVMLMTMDDYIIQQKFTLKERQSGSV